MTTASLLQRIVYLHNDHLAAAYIRRARALRCLRHLIFKFTWSNFESHLLQYLCKFAPQCENLKVITEIQHMENGIGNAFSFQKITMLQRACSENDYENVKSALDSLRKLHCIHTEHGEDVVTVWKPITNHLQCV